MQPKTIIAAEFTNGSAKRAPVVTINRIEGGERFWIADYQVSGKREALKVATKFGATPWNF